MATRNPRKSRTPAAGDDPTRRDFIILPPALLPGSARCAGLAVHRPDDPSADTLALASVEVDLTKIAGAGVKSSGEAAGVHPQPHARRRSPRRQDDPPDAGPRDPADSARVTKPGQGELAGHAWQLHAPGLRAAGSARVRTAAITAAGSAPATGRTTTPAAASAKARRRQPGGSGVCLPLRHRRRDRRGGATMSGRIPSPTNRRPSRAGWVDERLPLPRWSMARRALPGAAQPELLVEFRIAGRADAGHPDRHRHRAGDALLRPPVDRAFNWSSGSCAT